MNNIYDGIFYMSFYDFENIFTYIEIAHSNPSYQMSYVDFQMDDGTEKGIKITTTTAGHIYIGLEYYSPRMYADKCHNYTIGVASLFTQDGTLLAVNYASDYGLFNYFEFDSLQAGTYIAKVQNFYGPLDVMDFTARVISAGPVTLTKLTSAQVSTFT
jgi:hypothetical protein